MRIIRRATKEDANHAVPLLMLASGSIANTLSGTTDDGETLSILLEFFAQEGNRVSYQNALIAEEDGSVIGALFSYHGSQCEALDRPFLDRQRAVHGREVTSIEKEARDDEYYLDSIAVAEPHRGKGVAKDLIAAFEALARDAGHSIVALLAEEANTPAFGLYRKLGYAFADIVSVSGYTFHRMVKCL